MKKTTRVYDPLTNRVHEVPESMLTSVGFGTICRDAWHTLRNRLGLPRVEPQFEWRNRKNEHRCGDRIEQPLANGLARVVPLTNQTHVTILDGQNIEGHLTALADAVAAGQPARFGRLELPNIDSYAARLVCQTDDCSLRVLHHYHFGQPMDGDRVDAFACHWLTRVDVLFAPEPAAESALQFVAPACPRCGGAAYFLPLAPEDVRGPLSARPVACARCNWRGVSPKVAKVA